MRVCHPIMSLHCPRTASMNRKVLLPLSAYASHRRPLRLQRRIMLQIMELAVVWAGFALCNSNSTQTFANPTAGMGHHRGVAFVDGRFSAAALSRSRGWESTKAQPSVVRGSDRAYSVRVESSKTSARGVQFQNVGVWRCFSRRDLRPSMASPRSAQDGSAGAKGSPSRSSPPLQPQLSSASEPLSATSDRAHGLNTTLDSADDTPSDNDPSAGRTANRRGGTNVGRPHTPDSKRKISEANKNRTPWNKGGRHSEETKRKIGESVMRRSRERKGAKAIAAGMTLDEYEADLKQKSIRRRPKVVRDPTSEKGLAWRRKISERLKERWSDPVYRAKRKAMPIKKRVGFKHSEEIKEILRQSSIRRWQDPEYRAKVELSIAERREKKAALDT